VDVRQFAIITALACGPLFSGCGGSEFGESVSVPQERHTGVADYFSAGQTVTLPKDAPFNVADAQRGSNGGGTSESHADPAGKASCWASAQKGGDARAEFQLGQVIDNRGSTPLEATVRVRVEYAYSFEGDRLIRDRAPDSFGLKFYIMDSDKRVLNRVKLAELTDALGPKGWSGVQTQTFDVRFAPGLAYHLVLAGRVEVGSTESYPAAGRIDVQSLQIELLPRGVAAR
jgi:hypothetical protein